VKVLFVDSRDIIVGKEDGEHQGLESARRDTFTGARRPIHGGFDLAASSAVNQEGSLPRAWDAWLPRLGIFSGEGNSPVVAASLVRRRALLVKKIREGSQFCGAVLG